MKLESLLYTVFGISGIMGLIGIIDGVMVWSNDPYAGFLWLMISVLVTIFAFSGLARVRMAKDLETKATVGIQHSWWILSLGFSGVILFPAPFFVEHGGATSAYLMTAISALWIILGVVGIYKPHSETGISITI